MTLNEQWQEVIDLMRTAPLYQPIAIYPDDPEEFKTEARQWNKVTKVRLFSEPRCLMKNTLSGRVIDIGCNIAQIGFELIKRVPCPCDYYLGLDNDDQCLAFALALQKARKISTDALVIQKTSNLPLNLAGIYERERDERLHQPPFDYALFINVYHHLIGAHDWAYARSVIRQVSILAPVMFFSMATKAEPTNEDRAYWWSKLPEGDPNSFVIGEVIDNSFYKGVKTVGHDPIGRTSQRTLYQFNR